MDKWEVYMEMKQLLKKGFKVSNIARNLDVSRTTVYKYLERSPNEMAVWMAGTKQRSRKLEVYHELMLSWLQEHPNMSSAQAFDWLQERYDDIKVGESTVRTYVAELRDMYHIPKVKMKRDYEAIPDPPMGQQAQVDFGQTKQRTSSGKEIKLHFICFVLSHSRFKVVVWLDRPFTTRDVIRAHEYAFSKLGGMPYELVYDQDHLIVVNENAGDLLLTAEFQAYREQRKFSIHLCRKADPESKGRIENVVGFIKDNFAKHRVFHNIDAWNEQSELWLERTGNGKVHNTTKKRPVEVYALEKQHLKPISHAINMASNLDLSIPRVVRKDNTIRYKSNRYSVPLGTYTDREKTVYLIVTDDERLVIRDHPNGLDIATHRIDHRQGQLIQDRQHTRDRTKGIDGYINHIAQQFDDVDAAQSYLGEVRKLYRRYIRDQLQIISQEISTADRQIANEALRLCIGKKLFSATDFRDVMRFLNQQQGKHEHTPSVSSVKPLRPLDQSVLKAKPEIRDINDYVAILKGVSI